jgi:hypothetical protein
MLSGMTALGFLSTRCASIDIYGFSNPVDSRAHRCAFEIVGYLVSRRGLTYDDAWEKEIRRRGQHHLPNVAGTTTSIMTRRGRRRDHFSMRGAHSGYSSSQRSNARAVSRCARTRQLRRRCRRVEMSN